jgi:hypothetical protein
MDPLAAMPPDPIPLFGLLFWTAYGLYYVYLAWRQPDRYLAQTGPALFPDPVRLKFARYVQPALLVSLFVALLIVV